MAGKIFECSVYAVFLVKLAHGFLIYSPKRTMSQVESYTRRVHNMRLCGSFVAGTRNIREFVESSSSAQRSLFERNYHTLQETWGKWSEQGYPTETSNCSLSFTQGVFRITPYRLNEIDQPNRRVNWAWRLEEDRP